MDAWSYFSLIVIVVLAASNLWLFYRVLYPLRRLAMQTVQLSSGKTGVFQQSCYGIKEINNLQHSLASMAGHVQRAQRENLAYHTALTAGQEAERARIARELHDDTVQSLIAIAQSIELAANWIEKEPASATSMLKAARSQAVESVDNLRRLIGNLRPPALEELGLIPALRILANETTGIAVTISVKGIERRLDEAYELALFRSAQEAVNNAQKHSGAQRALIEVRYDQMEIHLRVTDDGMGFAVPPVIGTMVEQRHYGLVGIVERVESLNGQMCITSTPGQGTAVEITLPVHLPQQPAEMVRDPVCHAIIQPDQAYASLDYEGRTYYFCCPVCQGAFQRSPETYASAS